MSEVGNLLRDMRDDLHESRILMAKSEEHLRDLKKNMVTKTDLKAHETKEMQKLATVIVEPHLEDKRWLKKVVMILLIAFGAAVGVPIFII